MAPFTTPLANCADKAGNQFPELFSSPASALYAPLRPVLNRNNVRVFGHGTQVILFCNGFGCSQHIWHHLTANLATRYRLVLFDYVGSGGSDLTAYTSERYASLAGYAQDVMEVCQALELRDVILVGHSIGASIAMLASIAAPHHFRCLIALAASPHFLSEPAYYGGFTREDVEQLLALLQADYNTWANLFAGLMFDAHNHSLLARELAQHLCNVDPQIALQFAQVTLFSDCRADLAHVPVPTLLVQCAQDMAAPAEVGDYLLAHLPQATLVTLDTSGHCPHLSAPLETLLAIEAFLVQVE